MNKKLMLSSLLTVLTLGSFASASFADQHRCSSQQSKVEHRIERMSEHLKLSEPQTQQLTALLSKQYSDRKANRKQMNEIRKAVLQLNPKTQTYNADVERLASKAAEHTEQMIRLKALTMQKMAEVLTEEQLQKANKMKERIADKRRHRSEEHHDHG